MSMGTINEALDRDGIFSPVLMALYAAEIETMNLEQLRKIESYSDAAMVFLIGAINGTTKTMWDALLENNDEGVRKHYADTLMAIQLLTELAAHCDRVRSDAAYLAKEKRHD